MRESSNIKIGYAGMTHLGINYAAASSTRGFFTVGYDGSTEVINILNNDGLPVSEPDLLETISDSKNNNLLSFTDDINKLAECDIVYISADVMTDDQGKSDLSDINLLIQNVATVLDKDKTDLIILCQVPPGFTRKIDYPGHKLYYQVETLVFGQALERAVNPERLIIGWASNQPKNQKTDFSECYHTFLTAFKCPVVKMNYESAELAKIAINCFLTASISTTNMLAEICENIGAQWKDIVPALKLDKRIGQHAYLSPGLGISGGNLERDLSTINQLCYEHGTDSSVIRAYIHNSKYRKNWVLKVLYNNILNQEFIKNNISNKTKTSFNKIKIALLGLTYKPDTHSVKNSPSVLLLDSLIKNTNCTNCIFDLALYDPVVKSLENGLEHLNQTNTIIASDSNIDAVINNADVLIIMTPWGEFKNLNNGKFIEQMANNFDRKYIIDPFGVLNELVSSNDYGDTIEYFTLGEKL